MRDRSVTLSSGSGGYDLRITEGKGRVLLNRRGISYEEAIREIERIDRREEPDRAEQ